jgi:guanine deaminase
MSTPTEEQWMERAHNLATESVEQGTGPFGCVITDAANQLVAEGHNRVSELVDPTAHAEIVAIRRACLQRGTFDLSGCHLYSSCEPCPMCLSAIYWARIHQVSYGSTRHDAADIGFSDAFIYDELDKEIDDRSVHMKRVRSHNEGEGFALWSEKSDKVEY